jgi:hypothetical protein
MADDILDKVFSFISGDSETDPEKRNFLRQILRDLNENKYSKYYKPRSDEIEPVFAHTLYEIYKVIRPATVFIRDLNKAARLRQLALEVFMDKPTLAATQRLNPAFIEERIKTTPPKELIPQLSQDLSAITGVFDDARIRAVNVTNNQIIAFTQFVMYPFFTMLQKFDINLPEELEDSQPEYQPKFAAIKTKDIIKYLEDLSAIIAPLNPSENWKTVVAIMKLSNGSIEVIPLEQWHAVIRLVRDIRDSNILEKIIQYTRRDPLWQGKPKIPNERLAQTWLENKQAEVRHIINELSTREWSTQISALAQTIFGSADIVRLQFYTLRESENLTRKGLDSYIFAPGLNYLVTFIEDFVNREFQEICDILLIRGQWATAASSREMSEAFHSAKALHDGIIELDETLSDKGRNGPRLKAALLRVDRDRSQVRYINAIVTGINNEAQEQLIAAAEYFAVIDNYMKQVVEDLEKSPHELIINWKELSMFSKNPLGQRITDAYQKINSIVQLLKCFNRLPEEE